MPTVIKAVALDGFNTLFHNEPELWYSTFDRLIREHGLPVDGLTFFKHWQRYERRFRKTRTKMSNPWDSPPFKTYQEAWGESFQRVFQDMGVERDARTFTQVMVEVLASRELFPDAVPTLERLGGLCKVAILSNADNAYLRPLLQRQLMTFDVVLTSEDLRAYKPHPLAFSQVAQKLRCSQQEVMMVGDSLWDDVLGASLAGMPCVWLNRDGASLEEGIPSPNYEIKSLAELPKLLEKLIDTRSIERGRHEGKA